MLWTVVVAKEGFWSRVCQGGATKEIDSRVDEEGLAAMQQVCVVGYQGNRRSSWGSFNLQGLVKCSWFW